MSEETPVKALKRRGILAAAGAVVAGIVAKQTSRPVAAGVDGDVVLGNGLFDTTNNVASVATRITTTGSAGAAFRAFGGGNDRGMDAISDYGAALSASTGEGANANSPDTRAVIVTQYNHGPRGICIDTVNNYSLNGLGVQAVVYGSGGIGMKGVCDTAFGVGMQGHSTSYYGVQGITDNGIGVLGDVNAGGAGTSNIGVLGRVGVLAPNAQSNTTAVYGQNAATGAGGIGVYGSSVGGYGVLGTSTKVGFAGITGITSTANVAAFAGGSTMPSALAARFNGGVYIDCTTVAGGQFVVNPMTAKSGLLKHPDGSHRLMYSMEAPESWAEDFGEASLVGGKAEVKIDPDFAAVIHTDAYHVFLTAYGNTNGLHVTQRGTTGFTVEEHNGGKNSLTFSWRLVAKPKVDNHTATRLAKYDIPAPLHMPTKDELPTVAPMPPAGKKP